MSDDISANPEQVGRESSGQAPRAASTGPLRVQAALQGSRGDQLCRELRIHEALECYREATRLWPENPAYHYAAGMAAWQVGHFEWAEPFLRESVRLAPNNPQAHEALGQWCLEDANGREALFHSGRAAALAPRNPEFAVSHAFALQYAGETEAAWELLQRVMGAGFRSSRVGVLFGRLAPKMKREEEALSYVVSLLESPEMSGPRKGPLHFIAAELLDRRGKYDEAFAHACLGNEEGRGPWDPQEHGRRVDREIQFFTRERTRALPRAAASGERPIFIVGMFRSGTSLLEQILASHPQVFGAGELPAISRIANSAGGEDWAAGRAYPDYLEGLTSPRAEQLAGKYLAHLTSLNSESPRVTDKMPLNYLYLGIISLLFPKCRVVHCVRDPLDTCLSCYMTDFARGHDFTHDLNHLGTYYRDYQRLMDHWKQTLDLPILDVRYEDVVHDLEGQTRRLLAGLDLPWDENCLNFHNTRRHVGTASKDQVRKPIYASSIGRWKHYERHLGPLVEALGTLA